MNSLDELRIAQVEQLSDDSMFLDVLIFDVNNIVTGYIDNLIQTVPSLFSFVLFTIRPMLTHEDSPS